MHGPHHLARDAAIGGDVDLEHGKGNGDEEGSLAGDAVAKARRQAFDLLFGDGEMEGGGFAVGCFAHPTHSKMSE